MTLREPRQGKSGLGLDLPLAAYQDLDADLFINATNGRGALPALKAVGDALNSKVVIDTSNALDFSQGFPPSLFVSNTDSLAEQLQRELPEARLVKMFNTMANEVMVNPRGLGEDSTVFVAGNDATARQTAASLAADLGWTDVFDLGDLSARTRHGDVPSAVAADLWSARPRCVQHQGRALTSRRDQECVGAVSSETGSSPTPGSYPIDCSSTGGFVLRMKNAQPSAAMLITAATPKAA